MTEDVRRDETIDEEDEVLLYTLLTIPQPPLLRKLEIVTRRRAEDARDDCVPARDSLAVVVVVVGTDEGGCSIRGGFIDSPL